MTLVCKMRAFDAYRDHENMCFDVCFSIISPAIRASAQPCGGHEIFNELPYEIDL